MTGEIEKKRNLGIKQLMPAFKVNIIIVHPRALIVYY
jgi:hypothetical protein